MFMHWRITQKWAVLLLTFMECAELDTLITDKTPSQEFVDFLKSANVTMKHNHLYKSSSILTLEVTPVHSGVTSLVHRPINGCNCD